MDSFLCSKNHTSTLPKSSSPRNPDIFQKFRPAKNTCLDYKISQTDCKLETEDTKIHLQQTSANYIPNPKPRKFRKKIKYFRGKGPKWKFFEEIWLEKQDKLQKIYQEQLVKRLSEKKKLRRKFLEKAGPIWYQELSPKQLRAVDNLKNSISVDLAQNSIGNTQKNIGILGLAPRPDYRKIRKALKNSCQCPVEFLLTLYQILKNKKQKYSFNDRLLLSAVVHLTITDTLKELHIRIPSPPSSSKIKNPIAKKLDKVQNVSPYLDAFRQTPAKHFGDNKPTDDYFSYLKSSQFWVEETKHSSEAILETAKIDEEIAQQTESAQKIYENLVSFRPVPALLRPSVYKSCKNFRKTAEEKEIAAIDILDNQETTEDDNKTRVENQNDSMKQNLRKEERVKKTCTKIKKCKCRNTETKKNTSNCEKFSKSCKSTIKTQETQKNAAKEKDPESKHLCQCWEKVQKTIETPFCFCDKCLEDRKIKQTFRENLSSDFGNVTKCNCLEQYQAKIDAYENFEKRKAMICALKQQESKFVIGGVAITKTGPVYIISGAQQTSECICSSWKSKEEKLLPKVPPGRVKYNIAGVKETSKEKVFILNGAIPMPDCSCMAVLEQFEREHYGCMELLEQYLQQMKEDINQFQDDILQDSKRTNPIRNLSQISAEDTCLNKRRTQSTVKKSVVDVNCSTCSTKESSKLPLLQTRELSNATYIIGGVTNSPTGPVYIISGIKFDLSSCLPEETLNQTSITSLKNQRIFIFDKILCDQKWQQNVLKKALGSMAIDGYPLAKLPECYKLPHFRLWLQLRCRKI